MTNDEFKLSYQLLNLKDGVTLSPCPFCGGSGEPCIHEATIKTSPPVQIQIFVIRCLDCLAQGPEAICSGSEPPAPFMRSAVQGWNRAR